MEDDDKTRDLVLPENLTAEKKAEIARIIERPSEGAVVRGRRYPVDFRVTLPFFGGRKGFLAIIAGPETRSPERRKVERQSLPLVTPGNLIVFFAMAVLFVVAVAAAGLFFAFFNGSLFVG